MKKLAWENFPLPLIQVNPPDPLVFNEIIKQAYLNGVFSNAAQLQTECSKLLSRHVSLKFDGYLASSNTSGLIACLLALNVRGRHVVLSNFTFAATLHAVILAGGKPVLCDIDSRTLEMDKNSLSEILNSDAFDIAAVMPTRVFGFINDQSALIEKCSSLNIPVVTDAAASFPANENSWEFKAQSTYEVFSLHATKVFGIGEGGFVVGMSDSIASMKERANFGLDSNGSLSYVDGINAKADEFTAARALARFSEYGVDVTLRQEFVNIYKRCFEDDARVQTIMDPGQTIYSYFPVIFSSEDDLQDFQQALKPYLLTRRYYYPTIQSGYKGDVEIKAGNSLEISESIARRILCLPVYVSFEKDLDIKLEELIRAALRSIE